MLKRECIDETFDATQCGSYDLLAQASEEGFALAVLERLRKRFVAFVSFPTQINTPEDWMSAVTYLQTAYTWVKNDFKQVVLSYRGRKFTLIPSELFSTSVAKELLSTASAVDDLEEIHYFEPSNGITMVHAIPAQLTYAWRTMHKNSLFAHSDGAVIKAAVNGKHKGTQLLLVTKGAFATLIVTQGNRLLFALPIPIYTAEDALYYCTVAIKSLADVTSDVSILVVGSGVAWSDENDPRIVRQLKSSDIKTLLKNYFKVSDEPLAPFGYEYSYTVEKIRGEASSLFLLAECV